MENMKMMMGPSVSPYVNVTQKNQFASCPLQQSTAETTLHKICKSLDAPREINLLQSI